jgi:hypothetical protein
MMSGGTNASLLCRSKRKRPATGAIVGSNNRGRAHRCARVSSRRGRSRAARRDFAAAVFVDQLSPVDPSLVTWRMSGKMAGRGASMRSRQLEGNEREGRP